uniref:Uncharacterized protein n=1 Tax=Cacopsylla melanoneura TaxID=428564 RepID=A0A8D8V5Q0_9HEMI
MEFSGRVATGPHSTGNRVCSPQFRHSRIKQSRPSSPARSVRGARPPAHLAHVQEGAGRLCLCPRRRDSQLHHGVIVCCGHHHHHYYDSRTYNSGNNSRTN